MEVRQFVPLKDSYEKVFVNVSIKLTEIYILNFWKELSWYTLIRNSICDFDYKHLAVDQDSYVREHIESYWNIFLKQNWRISGAKVWIVLSYIEQTIIAFCSTTSIEEIKKHL